MFFLEAHRRLDSYLQAPRASFLLWLRRIVSDKLLEVHRNHLKLHCRSAYRETPLNRKARQVRVRTRLPRNC